MKVIKRDNIPTNLPVPITIIAWLLLDRLSAPAWVHGVVWTLLLILWVVAIVAIFTADYVDVFQKEKP